MIGEKVPEDDEHWVHFLQLLEILEIVFCDIVKPEIPSYLQVIIQDHLEEFKRLYPSASFRPKMHYLIHLPMYLMR